MRSRTVRSLLTFHCLVVAAFLSVTEVMVTAGEFSQDRRIPTTWKLDIRRVKLEVSTKPEHTKRLQERAVRKFREAGLNIGDDLKSNHAPPATLMLTLLPNSLETICSGKVLYDRKLEIVEDVFPERNDELRMRVSTWSLIGGPYVTDEVTIEKLEVDLDEYIHQFIIAYKFGNPGKGK